MTPSPPPSQARGGQSQSSSQRGESAYSAYQYALQALAHRGPQSHPPPGGYQNVQPQSYYPSNDTGYANGSGMPTASYGTTEVAYSTAATPGSGYSQGGAGYTGASGSYGPPPEAGGYMRQADGNATPTTSHPPTSYVPASAPGAYPSGYGGADYYNPAQYAHAQQYGYYPQ